MALWSGWPQKYEISLYYRGRPFAYSTEKKPIDLADAIMMKWPHAQRTIELRLRAKEGDKVWAIWDENTIERAEQNIEYDLSHDGYRVRTNRLLPEGDECTSEMIWKVRIKPI